MAVKIPVLYSFRRCPYAMRARLALFQSQQQVELREVKLSDKPVELTQISTKATVPVLVLADGKVLDESLDIMHWALQQNDPEQWLDDSIQQMTRQLIAENDDSFKTHLDQYKYFDRYPEYTQQQYRQQGEKFLLTLENLLHRNPYLLAHRMTLADMAIVPFIRQFAGVDAEWFSNCQYEKLRGWLNKLLATESFKSVMRKYDFWKTGDKAVYFPG